MNRIIYFVLIGILVLMGMFSLMDACFIFPYSERRKKKISEFEKYINELRSMDENELNFEYVNTKTDYDHKEVILSLFVIMIMSSILANTWKYIYVFMQKALQYSATQVESEMIAKVSFEISTITLISVTFIIFWTLLEGSKKIKMLQRKLMMIEMVMKERI